MLVISRNSMCRASWKRNLWKKHSASRQTSNENKGQRMQNIKHKKWQRVWRWERFMQIYASIHECISKSNSSVMPVCKKIDQCWSLWNRVPFELLRRVFFKVHMCWTWIRFFIIDSPSMITTQITTTTTTLKTGKTYQPTNKIKYWSDNQQE